MLCRSQGICGYVSVLAALNYEVLLEMITSNEWSPKCALQITRDLWIRICTGCFELWGFVRNDHKVLQLLICLLRMAVRTCN